MRTKLYNILKGLNKTCISIGKERGLPVPILNLDNRQTIDEIIKEIAKAEVNLRTPEYWYLSKNAKRY